MEPQLLFSTMMWLTGFCAFWTATWLWWHARFQPTLWPLAGFCAMFGLWCGGHIALQLQSEILGKALLLANPLMPMFFLQFAVRFVEGPQLRWLAALKQVLPLLFVLSGVVVLLSWLQPSAAVTAVAGLPYFFVFSGFGWFNLGYTVLIGVAAHAVLWLGLPHQSVNKQRSVAAISMTAGLGLLLASSFVLPSFGLNIFPYPMLLLPGYLILLVYSVLRYQMLAVNAFASKALFYLAMALLMVLSIGMFSVLFGQLGMPALAAVPGWQLWLYSSLLLLVAAAAYRPLSRLAERLIYPGVQLDQHMVADWQQQLSQQSDWQSLAEKAALLISLPLKQQVTIIIQADQQPALQSKTASALRFSCIQRQQEWQFNQTQGGELTPTLKLTTEVFGSILASCCVALERALALAAAEKQQLSQQHLVELGALAAAMAHELRNPLNIISMASASVDAELRSHIQSQLKRADRLIADMLVYAGKLQLQLTQVQLLPLVQSLLTAQQSQHFAEQQQWQLQLAIDPALQVRADAYRLQQVLQNLLDNAAAFLQQQADGILRIEAQQLPQQVRIVIHNNGPAVDPQLVATDHLFRPFVSKRPGGSGLGLAIVKRIIDAHHGRICHRQDLGFAVSFEILLPQEQR